MAAMTAIRSKLMACNRTVRPSSQQVHWELELGLPDGTVCFATTLYASKEVCKVAFRQPT